MSEISILDKKTIALIAAGEVVLRPLDAIKELIENSIDSGASKIEINLENSGKNCIEVIDNGCGISKDGLEKCLLRNATSKVKNSDITHLMYMGFRGEGLYAIASISRISIESTKNGYESYMVFSEEGKNIVFLPSAIKEGTRVSVKSLFFNTPVKLKFLKSDASELNDIKNLVIGYSIIHSNVSFMMNNNGKQNFFFTASDFESRILEIKILGNNFLTNAFKFEKNSENYRVCGYASLPNANLNNKKQVYAYINNRIIKDDLINMAIKTAYKDYLLLGKSYTVILIISTEYSNVDVNIHPNKMKVRFLYEREIVSLIISAIKYGLLSNGQNIASNVNLELEENIFFKEDSREENETNKVNETKKLCINNVIDLKDNVVNWKRNQKNDIAYQARKDNIDKVFIPTQSKINISNDSSIIDNTNDNNHISEDIASLPISNFDTVESIASTLEKKVEKKDLRKDFGVPICQLYNTYIISQNHEGFYLIDQHAVHERILYEKYKNILESSSKTLVQNLLINELITLPKYEILSFLLDNSVDLKRIGFSISIRNEEDLVIEVMSIPAFLKNANILEIIQGLYEAFFDDSLHINNKLERFYADYACKNAIKAGKKLNFEEMVQLIKQMEMCDRIAQCNHGRATYTFLSKKKLDSFFDRV